MHRSLAGPFALLSAAGGWLTADLAGLRYARRDEVLLRVMLLLLTPIVAALVGWKVAPKGRTSIPRFLLVPLAGGALNGGLIGLVAEFPKGGVGGAIVGPFVAVGFLPFLALAFAAARASLGRAGSLLAKVERRGVWGASFAGVALGTLVPRLMTHPHAEPGAVKGEIALASAMAIGAVVLALLDSLDLARLSRLVSRSLAPRSTRTAAESIDLGVGNGASEEQLAPAASYRDGGTVREYVGDAAQLRGAVRSRFVIDALIVAAAAAAVAVTALAPLPQSISF